MFDTARLVWCWVPFLSTLFIRFIRRSECSIIPSSFRYHHHDYRHCPRRHHHRHHHHHHSSFINHHCHHSSSFITCHRQIFLSNPVFISSGFLSDCTVVLQVSNGCNGWERISWPTLACLWRIGETEWDLNPAIELDRFSGFLAGVAREVIVAARPFPPVCSIWVNLVRFALADVMYIVVWWGFYFWMALKAAAPVCFDAFWRRCTLTKYRIHVTCWPVRWYDANAKFPFSLLSRSWTPGGGPRGKEFKNKIHDTKPDWNQKTHSGTNFGEDAKNQSGNPIPQPNSITTSNSQLNNLDLNNNRKKVTPPAMTPRNLTFFPASQFAVLQPFQGFVTFAFWHDLHFYWYLHDFVVVFMNLQWSKHSFFVPYTLKKPKFLYFSLASLCQRAKFFQSRILGRIASPHKTVYVTSNLLIQVSIGGIFGRQFLWNIFFQT